MAKDINTITLLGNIGQEPDMKYTPSGKAITKCTLATNRSWQGKDGEWQKETTWHNIQCWEDLAEKLNTLGKGDRVYVEGALKVDEYEKDGEKKRFYYVLVRDFHQVVKDAPKESGAPKSPKSAPEPEEEAIDFGVS